MKALKLLIFAMLFVAGQQAFAQDVIVNNNLAVGVDVNFNFAPPCGSLITSTATNTSSTTPYTQGCNLSSLDIVFTDNTCTPPVKVTIPYTITSIPTSFTYTLCNGYVVTFSLNFVGTDYILDIF